MDINYFKAALSHHSKGNWNKAQEIYQHLLKEDPNNYVVLQNYAPLLAQLREYKLAKGIFEKCLKIKPNDSMMLYNYGKFFHDQKIYEKAIKYYNKSFEINPKNAMSKYNIGNIYFSQNKLETAIKNFKIAAKVNPSHFLAYNNIGLSFKKLGNFDEALKFYKKTIDTNKDFADGHVNYGTLLLLTNKLKSGFQEYEWRKKSKTFSDYLNYLKLEIKSPIWTDQNLEKKTILIFSEQGIGDLIQFSRYLFILKEIYSCKVILRLKHNFEHFFDDTIEIITENEKKTIAFHEAGHATVSWFLEHAAPLVKVTIVPRGQSLGAAWYLPEERQIVKPEQILDEMCAALGGRAAEKVMFNNISTGALSDLEKVTKQARSMVTVYGLNDKIGNLTYYDSSGQNDYGFTKPYSDVTAQIIDKEISNIIETQYQRAIKLLKKHKKKLIELADFLLDKEVIFKEDLVRIYGERPFDLKNLPKK